MAVDPGFSASEDADGTGIVVAGIGEDKRGYVLEDLSGQMELSQWARKVVAAYHRHEADAIVAEINMNGKMVTDTIKTYAPNARVVCVRATRGKAVRAEPVSSLYEQGRISHVGSLPHLEDEMCSWDPGMSSGSPGRLDALVWAFTDLMIDRSFGASDARPRVSTRDFDGQGSGY